MNDIDQLIFPLKVSYSLHKSNFTLYINQGGGFECLNNRAGRLGRAPGKVVGRARMLLTPKRDVARDGDGLNPAQGGEMLKELEQLTRELEGLSRELDSQHVACVRLAIFGRMQQIFAIIEEDFKGE